MPASEKSRNTMCCPESAEGVPVPSCKAILLDPEATFEEKVEAVNIANRRSIEYMKKTGKKPRWAKKPPPPAPDFTVSETKRKFTRMTMEYINGQPRLYQFYTAARTSMIPDLEDMLEAKDVDGNPKFVVDELNEYGFTPLLFACTYGQSKAVEFLLENGADIKHQDNYGFSVLHKACYTCKVELVEELIKKHGADCSLVDKKGRYGWEVCKMHQEKEELRNLFPAPYNRPSPLRTEPDSEHDLDEDDYQTELEFGWEPPENAIEPTECKAAEAVDGLIPLARGEGKIVVLCPGQGAQRLEMLPEKPSDAVKELIKGANEILGWDVEKKIMQGPLEELNKTSICQPAIFIASLASWITACEADPTLCKKVNLTAGLSLGEYVSLVIAGSIDWKEALKLVKRRGEAMQKAAALARTNMLSIVGLDDEQIAKICEETGCTVANELFPKCRVIGGKKKEAEAAKELADKAGAMKTQMLAVAGAFHTPHMKDAQGELNVALDQFDDWRKNTVTVLANTDAKPYPGGAISFPVRLRRQLVQPVKWEAIVSKIPEDTDRVIELAPSKQIKAMIRRSRPDLFKKFTCLPEAAKKA